MQLAFILPVICIAGMTQGMFGIGFAMVATPLLLLRLDYTSTVLLCAVPLLALALNAIASQWRTLLTWPMLRLLAVAIAIGGLLGTLLHMAISPRDTKLLLALLLTLNIVGPFWLNRPVARSLFRSRPGIVVIGALAGVTETALNVGAPFMLMMNDGARLAQEKRRLSLNVCFAVGKTIQLFWLAGSASATLSPWTMIGAVAAALATYGLGRRFAGRYPEIFFKRAFTTFLVGIPLGLLAGLYRDTPLGKTIMGTMGDAYQLTGTATGAGNSGGHLQITRS